MTFIGMNILIHALLVGNNQKNLGIVASLIYIASLVLALAIDVSVVMFLWRG